MLVKQAFADIKPPICQIVIRMFIIEELDYDQICERLSIPNSTARSHVRRGLRKFREKLISRGILDNFREATK